MQGDRPKRIQRKRTKGWRLPDGAACVTRPGLYGNPFKPGADGPMGRRPIDSIGAVGFFRDMLHDPELRAAAGYPSDEQIRRDLGGRDLACYCELRHVCHADVLLEIANSTEGTPK